MIWTYTQRFIIDWTFTENSSLNWFYDLSFFLDYPAYKIPTLIIKDWIETNWPERLFIAEFDETVVNQETVIANVPPEFNLTILDNPTERIRANTNYIEESEGKFIIQDESIWIDWEITNKVYLTI